VKPAEEQLEQLRRGVVSIISEDELLTKLRRGQPLRVKLGLDPTAPDIHLGHTVQLRKLRQFQDLGHTAVLIVGDYTAMVGDPSGRSKTRPQLSHDQVMAHAETYVTQVKKVLREDRLEIAYNGDWFAQMQFVDVLKLCSRMTVARMLEREEFSRRYRGGDPIAIHEFLYCLMQGQDSVEIRSDVELGATEQLFNLLVGRELQRDVDQEPQVCLTFPILVGTDGTQRMGKSLGNYVGLTDPPNEMFGKIMSLPDHAVRDYFILLTDTSEAEIERLLSGHPKAAKVALGRQIVTMYHDAESAEAAAEEFERVFARKELPTEIPEAVLPAEVMEGDQVWIVKLLTAAKLAPSGREARRLVEQGAVEVDGERVRDLETRLKIPKDGLVVKAGKRRFARVKRQP